MKSAVSWGCGSGARGLPGGGLVDQMNLAQSWAEDCSQGSQGVMEEGACGYAHPQCPDQEGGKQCPQGGEGGRRG